MRRGLFITGTDTGVGKTVVSACLLRLLRREGLDAVPMKPVQTGATEAPDGARAPDLEFCLAAAGISPPPDERALMAPFLYMPACSPHLAARLAGDYPDVVRIERAADALLAHHDALVVEGAGGVMAPLNEAETMLDLMRVLKLPVLLVARAGLGTINHTLLSLMPLRMAGLHVVGVLFNADRPSDAESAFIAADNPDAVRQFGRVNILGLLPHAAGLAPDDECGWEAIEAGITGMARIREAMR